MVRSRTTRLLLVAQADSWLHEIKAILESLGHSVRHEDNYNQGVTAFQHGVFHVVVFASSISDSSGKLSNTAGLELFDVMRHRSPYTTYLLVTSDPVVKAVVAVIDSPPFKCIHIYDSKPSEVCDIIKDALKARVTTVRSWDGGEQSVDPLDFWEEEGILDSTLVADSTFPGKLRLQSGLWQATLSQESSIACIWATTKVRAKGVIRGRIEVVPSTN